MISFTYDLPEAYFIEGMTFANRGRDNFDLLMPWTFIEAITEYLSYNAEGSSGHPPIARACSVAVRYLNKITDFHAITSKCP
jgi:hypothetical protein